jgi:glucan 1,3-beta-glucosidase
MASFNTFRLLQLFLALFLPVLAVPKPQAAVSLASSSSYWVSTIPRQGTVAYGNDTNYQIFRNVMSFGAKGTASLPGQLLGPANVWQVTVRQTIQ